MLSLAIVRAFDDDSPEDGDGSHEGSAEGVKQFVTHNNSSILSSTLSKVPSLQSVFRPGAIIA